MDNRPGDPKRTYYRIERFYTVERKYFFSTREGCELGPYDTKEDAALALERFVRTIKSKGGCLETACQAARDGNWAITHFK
jgi:hypothetical protein